MDHDRAGLSTEPAILTEELHDAVGLLRRRSRRLAGTPFPGLSLTGAQVELVRLVRRQPGLGVAEAATALGLAPNTVSTLVGQLVALGVVVRDRHDRDRRVAALRLADDARISLEQWRDRRSLATTEALGRLSPQQRETLRRALPLIQRLAESLPVDSRANGLADEPRAGTGNIPPTGQEVLR